MNSLISFHKLIRIGIVCVIFGLFGAMFVPFFSPILMAALFAFAVEPLVHKYELKKSTRRAPAALILLGLFIFLAAPLGLVGYRLSQTALSLSKDGSSPIFQKLESIVSKSDKVLERSMSSLHIAKEETPVASDAFGKAGKWAMEHAMGFATDAPEIALKLFIFCAALYVFLTETTWIKKTISGFNILTHSELNQIIQIVQKNSYTTLIASASIGAIQALIVASMAKFFGYSEFLLIFITTFFAAFVPVIGAAPVALVLGLFCAIQDQWLGFGGLAVAAIIVVAVEHTIKPYIISASSEESLNPVISFLAIIGAVLVYGLPGILLGPLLTELALKILPILFPSAES